MSKRDIVDKLKRDVAAMPQFDLNVQFVIESMVNILSFIIKDT